MCCPQPVNKPPGSRIAPVSAVLAGARRDPRLARRAPPAPPATTSAPTTATPAPPTAPPAPKPAAPPIAPNVFDIKPLERHVTKRKNVITIDVRPEEPIDAYMQRLRVPDPKSIDRLPPIPKIPKVTRTTDAPPSKRKKDATRDRKKRKEDKAVPERRRKVRDRPKSDCPAPAPAPAPAAPAPALAAPAAPVAFKELRNYHKERYMRRNKQPDSPDRSPGPEDTSKTALSRATVILGCKTTHCVEIKYFSTLGVFIIDILRSFHPFTSKTTKI